MASKRISVLKMSVTAASCSDRRLSTKHPALMVTSSMYVGHKTWRIKNPNMAHSVTHPQWDLLCPAASTRDSRRLFLQEGFHYQNSLLPDPVACHPTIFGQILAYYPLRKSRLLRLQYCLRECPPFNLWTRWPILGKSGMNVMTLEVTTT
jgi:hypothetical protein